MALNKNIKIRVKHNQGDWLGVDGTYAYAKNPAIANNSLNLVQENTLFQNKVMQYVDYLKNNGYKIDERKTLNDLKDDLKTAGNRKLEEQSKAEKTKNNLRADYPETETEAVKFALSHPFAKRAQRFSEAIGKELSSWNQTSSASGQWNDMFNQLQQTLAWGVLENSLNKEIADRIKVDNRIADAQRRNTLSSYNSVKNDWRSLEQKKIIEDSIKALEEQTKKDIATKQAEADAKAQQTKAQQDKQKQLDELNAKIANTSDPKEKQKLIDQASALVGGVSTSIGIPKGAMYIGIGIAVMVGIWITIKAIRK